MHDLTTQAIITQALKSNDPAVLNLALQIASHPLYRFKPRPNDKARFDEQAAFVDDRFKGIACALGGSGAGKTHSASAKVARFLDTTPPPEKNTPFWVLSKTMDMTAAVCWGQGLSNFILPNQIQDIIWYRQARGLPRQVILKPHANGNNYVLEFKSYDMQREALQGTSIVGWWADEQMELTLMNEIIARTRKWEFPGSQCYTLTPLNPDPQLEERFNNPDQYPNWKFYRLNTEMNLTLKDSYVAQLKENECDALIQTRLTGAFARYEGCIYPNFGKQHIVEPFDIPKHWLRVGGLDLGWSHCTAFVVAALDEATDTYYVTGEYNANQTSLEDHVNEIRNLWDGHLVRGHLYADPASPQTLYEFRLRGLDTVAAIKDVKAGIAHVATLLRPGKDGQPKLKIFSTCKMLISQMRCYVYDPENGKPKKENENYLNDLVDSLRYCCLSHKLNKEEKPFDGKLKRKELPQPPSVNVIEYKPNPLVKEAPTLGKFEVPQFKKRSRFNR